MGKIKRSSGAHLQRRLARVIMTTETLMLKAVQKKDTRGLMQAMPVSEAACRAFLTYLAQCVEFEKKSLDDVKKRAKGTIRGCETVVLNLSRAQLNKEQHEFLKALREKLADLKAVDLSAVDEELKKQLDDEAHELRLVSGIGFAAWYCKDMGLLM